MNTEPSRTKQADDSDQDIIDPLIAAAHWMQSEPPVAPTPDLTNAESYLTAADRQALEGLDRRPGDAIVTGGDRRPIDTNDDPLTSTMGAMSIGSGPVEKLDQDGLELLAQYDAVSTSGTRIGWQTDYELTRRLGSGGQGVVYLSEYHGADDFAYPVAVKLFSPQPYGDGQLYEEAMRRMAHVSSIVAQLHHHSLVDSHSFVHRDRIRMLVMEWVDGYDLRQLLVPSLLSGVRSRVSNKLWEFFSRVIVTPGREQPRFKVGIAVGIIRECLAALDALHSANVIHGDIKQSNIMLRRTTGHAKIIDLGSAHEVEDRPPNLLYTPVYAAPEVLERGVCTPQSDLASLGYVLVELLSGQRLFKGVKNRKDLLAAKRNLPRKLNEILPDEVTRFRALTTFCHRLIAPDPVFRFSNAREADLHPDEGASFINFELVRGDLASVFDNDLREWLNAVREWDDAMRGTI